MVSIFKFKPSKEDRRLVFYLTRTKICLRLPFLNPIYWLPTRNTWAEKIQISSSFIFKIIFFLLSRLNFDICCSFVALRNKEWLVIILVFVAACSYTCPLCFCHFLNLILGTCIHLKKIKNMFTFKGKFYQSIT